MHLVKTPTSGTHTHSQATQSCTWSRLLLQAHTHSQATQLCTWSRLLLQAHTYSQATQSCTWSRLLLQAYTHSQATQSRTWSVSPLPEYLRWTLRCVSLHDKFLVPYHCIPLFPQRVEGKRNSVSNTSPTISSPVGAPG